MIPILHTDLWYIQNITVFGIIFVQVDAGKATNHFEEGT